MDPNEIPKFTTCVTEAELGNTGKCWRPISWMPHISYVDIVVGRYESEISKPLAARKQSERGFVTFTMTTEQW